MNFFEKYGPWALITGASSGLGLAYAEFLAKQKMNLVLLARRDQILQSIANRLIEQHGIKVRVAAVDLTDKHLTEKLLPYFLDIEIGMLVNNAGMGAVGDFMNVDLDRHLDLLRVNCIAPVVLTHYLMRGMKIRKRGAIIFVGSVVGHGGTPYYSTYAASKAFNISLAKSIWLDAYDNGLDVLVVSPGTVRTSFHQNAGMKRPVISMSPDKVVRLSMKRLGKQVEYVPGFFNAILVKINDMVSGRWYYRLKRKMLKKIIFSK